MQKAQVKIIQAHVPAATIMVWPTPQLWLAHLMSRLRGTGSLLVLGPDDHGSTLVIPRSEFGGAFVELFDAPEEEKQAPRPMPRIGVPGQAAAPAEPRAAGTAEHPPLQAVPATPPPGNGGEA